MGHLRCVAGFGVRGLDGVVFVLTISEEAVGSNAVCWQSVFPLVCVAMGILNCVPYVFQMCILTSRSKPIFIQQIDST